MKYSITQNIALIDRTRPVMIHNIIESTNNNGERKGLKAFFYKSRRVATGRKNPRHRGLVQKNKR